MADTIDYKYTQYNQLTYKEKYQYSQYFGDDFWDLYLRDRRSYFTVEKKDRYLNDVGDMVVNSETRALVGALLLNLNLDKALAVDFYSLINNVKNEGIRFPHCIINDLNNCFDDEKKIDEDFLFIFQRKYEISKRLYLNYREETIKNIGKPSLNGLLYGLFHMYLMYGHKAVRSPLKKASLLSTIFKVGDLISSNRNEISGFAELAICRKSIELELALYDECCEVYL